MKSGGPPPISTVISAHPTLLAIGGLDPGAGAGLLRDLLTASALGASVHAVGTAWTEQAAGVHTVEPRQPAALEDAVRYGITRRPQAVKIGMVPDAAAAAAILAGLEGYPGPVVVDPVMASSRGGALWRGEPAGLLPLLRRATLATPNALEAAALSGRPVNDLDQAGQAALVLRQAGLAAVLVKGGHFGATTGPITDLLLTAAGARRLAHDRIPGASPRGTGCALATAVAIALGRGAALEDAARTATEWLARAIAAAVDVAGERHLPGPG